MQKNTNNSSEIKIEISNNGTPLKPEIKPNIEDACDRVRFLIEMGYQIALFQKKRKGQWQPIKTPRIRHIPAQKL